MPAKAKGEKVSRCEPRAEMYNDYTDEEMVAEKLRWG
jgi:hypothetical protein